MGITHSEILETERFGTLDLREGDRACSCCGIVLEDGFEEIEADRFGRCFCCAECRRIFYGGITL